jgi:hypothetical protein
MIARRKVVELTLVVVEDGNDAGTAESKKRKQRRAMTVGVEEKGRRRRDPWHRPGVASAPGLQRREQGHHGSSIPVLGAANGDEERRRGGDLSQAKISEFELKYSLFSRRGENWRRMGREGTQGLGFLESWVGLEGEEGDGDVDHERFTRRA